MHTHPACVRAQNGEDDAPGTDRCSRWCRCGRRGRRRSSLRGRRRACRRPPRGCTSCRPPGASRCTQTCRCSCTRECVSAQHARAQDRSTRVSGGAKKRMRACRVLSHAVTNRCRAAPTTPRPQDQGANTTRSTARELCGGGERGGRGPVDGGVGAGERVPG
eukprot:3629874-Rhodomonas_salina.1